MGGISNSAQRRTTKCQSKIVMLNEVLALSNGSTEQSRSAEVKHLNNTIKGDPSLRSG